MTEKKMPLNEAESFAENAAGMVAGMLSNQAMQVAFIVQAAAHLSTVAKNAKDHGQDDLAKIAWAQCNQIMKALPPLP